MRRTFLPLLLAVTLFSGCASSKYAKVPKGEVGGRVIIEWISANQFIFHPDSKHPFYFKRANGELIRPKLMYTDGGSIPRQLWSLRGYSPWGYGPAYIAHDWLFAAHNCHLSEAKNHTVFTAADVLSECMKTLMETNKDVIKSPYLLYTIDAAVRTPIAQNYWNTGKCLEPPPELMSPSRFRAPFPSRASGTRGFVESYDLDALKR